jgi:hypothetical protein
MSRSWVKYLGFLGFLSIIALFTSNWGFLGFATFFIYFIYRNSVNDERFQINVGKSGRNAFIVSMLVFALSLAYAAIAARGNMDSVLAFVFIQSFVLQTAAFNISLIYYDKAGAAA